MWTFGLWEIARPNELNECECNLIDRPLCGRTLWMEMGFSKIIWPIKENFAAFTDCSVIPSHQCQSTIDLEHNWMKKEINSKYVISCEARCETTKRLTIAVRIIKPVICHMCSIALLNFIERLLTYVRCACVQNAREIHSQWQRQQQRWLHIS